MVSEADQDVVMNRSVMVVGFRKFYSVVWKT